MKKINIDTTKALGIGAMVLGIVANLISGFIDGKKTDAMIAEKVKTEVANALSKKDN